MLVSNSGLTHLQPLQDITAAQFDEMPAVNLRAPFLLAHCAAGPCGNRGSAGSCISRVAAFTGGIIDPHYAASKARLHGLTHFLGCRLAAAGVTVNALAAALVTETTMLPGDPAPVAGRCRPAGSAGHPRSPASPRPSLPRPT